MLTVKYSIYSYVHQPEVNLSDQLQHYSPIKAMKTLSFASWLNTITLANEGTLDNSSSTGYCNELIFIYSGKAPELVGITPTHY